jgi:hypothetical protein
LSGSHTFDPAVEEVAQAIGPVLPHVPTAIHAAKYLVLAPEQTGRLDILGTDVDPEEKSYVGKRIEINFLTAAGLPRGSVQRGRLDTVVAGHEVDVKTSITGKVMLAPKNIGEIILIILHDPRRDSWSVGVVRVMPGYLNASKSRDSKQTLNSVGRDAILWLERHAEMPEELRNPLQDLPVEAVHSILSQRSGQAKLNALFAVCLDTPIPRWLVVALGQQVDAAKRVRDARLKLEPRGIRILSTRYDRAELEHLGLNPPESPAFFFGTRRTAAPGAPAA